MPFFLHFQEYHIESRSYRAHGRLSRSSWNCISFFWNTDDPSQRPHFPVNVHSRYIQNYWSIIKLLLMKNVKLFKMKNQYYCIIMGTLMIFWRNPPKTNFWVNFSIFDPLFCTQFLSPQFLKKGQLYDFDSWPSYGSYIWLPLGTLGFALPFWNW